jgi:hypothetical protein
MLVYPHEPISECDNALTKSSTYIFKSERDNF